VTDFEIPAGGSAEVHVLHEGYVGLEGDDERVSGTVTLIVDGGTVIVVDPGMVADRGALVAALAEHGPGQEDVTDVACTHAWWFAAGPEEDPLGTDAAALKASRDLLLKVATVIIPGHGAPFRPGEPA
jgi:glyoxylase-like metal-dependent hydrolase (beta-lactamase superfamily II)